jgi:carboxylesterase type B
MFVMFAAGLAIARQPAPVKVEGGLVQGTSEDGLTVYKGIPFAAPPIGELRWRAPQPPAPWEGVRMADKSSANPVQEMREGLGPWTAEDEKIAGTMSAYWTNFIATGGPNGKGLPRWPTFSETPEQTMELGDTMGLRPIASRDRFEALKKLWQDTVHQR